MAENKGYVTSLEENGTVNISEEVIASIASAAVTEVDGVSGFAASFGSDLLGKRSQQKPKSKGLKIVIEDDKVIVDVYVLLDYGVVIGDVARGVQDKVSSEIESMTGIAVTAVNVNVCGIAFGKAKDKN